MINLTISSVFSLALVLLFSFCVHANIIKNSRLQNSRNGEWLDAAEKISLNWTVNEATKTITFELEAETLGWVGFGISPQGGMTGADIFIAGALPNGDTYSSDRHATGTTEPIVDAHQDWVLHDAKESTNRTYLKFSRLLDTCDDQDYPIGMDTTRLIWAFGITDDITYHTSTRRGTKSVNLRGAPMPDVDLTKLKEHKMVLDMVMPPNNTAYWCSFHKGPQLDKKNHIVAFDSHLPNLDAIAHTHHFILYNCYGTETTPIEEIMANYTVDKYLGDNCYLDYNEENPIPVTWLKNYCKEYLYVWAKGGKRMVFPENVGYPIGYGDQAGKEIFYMLEIHYDNPDMRTDIQFETGVSFFYTNETRDIDAGQLMVGHDVTPSITIPPNANNFVTVGHCASKCTSEQFPEGGIKIFNALLHSHVSGRKLKLRQFRGQQELEWPDFDDHYDFDYQQNKHLNQEVVVLPGDHLTYECTYSSVWKNGSVVIGGLSTEDEMCQTFLWYYPKIEAIEVCGSFYDVELSVADLGITNWTGIETPGSIRKVFIYEPTELAGDLEESLSTKFPWTKEIRDEMERKRRYEDHVGICASRKNSGNPDFKVKYPIIATPYEPADTCRTGGGNGLQLGVVHIFMTIFVGTMHRFL